MLMRIILAVIAAAFFAAGALLPQKNDKTENAEPPQATVEPARSFTLTTTGDCTFATDINASRELGFVTYAEEYGSGYFLEKVRDIFSEDDITLVNFEGTLSERGEREDKQFAFRGDPSYADILTCSSVEAANLANNHSSDYGAVSLEDTREILEGKGIITCRGLDNISIRDVNGIKVGFVGINYLNDEMKTELEDAVKAAREGGAEVVVLSIHWGIEKATEPNEEQVEAAHRAVDCGADVVIGTHPHVLQGIEKYRGKYICYSLGNFCFGGNNAPSDRDTALFRQTFTIENGQLLDDDAVEVIPCRICGSGDYNNYQPVPAEGDTAERIRKKLTIDNAQLTIKMRIFN